jgi:peptidoglycan/xylan/chitin deacetylase (PgdA/CDA1 family)
MKPEMVCMVFRIKKRHLLALPIALVCVLLACALHSRPARQTMAAPQTRRLPVVMYHHVLRDPSRAGRYVLPEAQLERDPRFLKEAGYESVTVGDLLAFVRGERELPDRIVMLTFDDGYQSMETYVLPLLAETNSKAVLSVVGSFAEVYTDSGDTNVNYACLSWDALRRLSESGRFELQSHTWALHDNRHGRRGLAQKKGESDDSYRAMLTADLQKNQDAIRLNTGAAPTALVYPFGAFSAQTKQIAADCGFVCTMTCEEKVNTITAGDEACLFGLGRFNRPAGPDSAAFFQKLGITADGA